MAETRATSSAPTDSLLTTLTTLQQHLDSVIAVVSEHQRIQRLLQGVAQVSHSLLIEGQANSTIAAALRRIGELIDADSAALFTHEHDPHREIDILAPHTVWDNDPAPVRSKALVVEYVRQWPQTLARGEAICVRAEDQPEHLRSLFEHADVASMVLVPTPCKGEYRTLLVLATSDPARFWSSIEMNVLMTAAAGIGGALVQQQADDREIQLQQELSKVQHLESLGLLTRGVAHDFNNILQVMIGQLELLSQHEAMTPAMLADLEPVHQMIERASQLVRQIRLYAGQTPQHREMLLLKRLIDDTIQLARPALSPNVTLQTRVVPASLSLVGDPVQIHQVLLNLVINAGEAIGQREGRISIQARYLSLGMFDEAAHPGQGDVEITVEDTGSGMDRATRARIFEPFFSTKQDGWGLGLTTVLGIVKAHKGNIEVESIPGRGTTFRIVLPTA